MCYIQKSTLKVQRKHLETVSRSLRGKVGFAASLDEACREFINRNAATGTSNSKSPELLPKHAELLLRKNKLAEGNLDGALNRAV
jgi:cullin 1